MIGVSARQKIDFTYDDYCLINNGKRYEILEGNLMMVPAPNEYHQRILINLVFHLMQYVKRTRIGDIYCAPFDVILDDTDVVQPDILYVSAERRSVVTSDGLRGAPDLAIEILSRSSVQQDKIIKRKLYYQFGVLEYWIVDPETQSVDLLIPGTADFELQRKFTAVDQLASDLFPSLLIPLAEIFGS